MNNTILKGVPIYIINLDRSPERLEYVQRQFSIHNINFNRISALDGAKLPKDELSIYKGESKHSLSHYASLSNGEIGCGLSQKKAWGIASESNHRATVVLEDDVEISDEFSSIIQTLYENMDENIVIDLKGKKGFFELERIHLPNGINLIHYSTPPLGTQGAIFGKNAATNLLNKVTGFEAPIDNLMQRIYNHKVEIWSLDQGCISHETEASGGASIIRKSGVFKKLFNEVARPFWRANVKIRNLIYHKF
jgi:GR25 family glycosyltransferase involved in LPS biosynthesis